MPRAQLKNLEDITKEEFMDFEDVRRSGLVNMLDSRVCDLANLDKDTHFSITHFYSELDAKWPDVRKDQEA